MCPQFITRTRYPCRFCLQKNCTELPRLDRRPDEIRNGAGGWNATTLIGYDADMLHGPPITFLILALAFAQEESPDTRLQSGISLAARGEFEAAVEPLRAACAQAPELENACYLYGRNLFTLGRYGEAVEPFRQALRTAPAPALWRVHRAAAMNFQALGRAAEAERHYREAMRLSNDGALRVDFGAFLFRQGRTQEALAPLEAAARTNPTARAHGELGRVLLQMGRLPEAARRLETAVAQSPKDAAFRLLLGKAYIQLGRMEEGERELRLARQGI